MERYLKVNDVLMIMDRPYRILFLVDTFGIMIEMDTKKMNIQAFDLEKYEEALEEGLICLKEEEKQSLHYIHPEQLTGRGKQIYEQYVYTANAVTLRDSSLEWLLSCKERAIFLRESMEQNVIGETTARTRLREYLQNGMTLRGLEAKYYNCGGRGKERIYEEGCRPGRKGTSAVVLNEKIISIFEKTLKRYKAHKMMQSIASCYTEMVKDYFSDKKVVNGEVEYTLYPLAGIPTKRQLYYYVHKNMSSADKYESKYGHKKALNDIRPLFSDTIHALDEQTIGFYEVDEMETDYELVDAVNRNQVIGRAIMYMIIDIISKEIVGYSVGIDNNSWAGVEMALLNMVEDKVQYCAEKGIRIQKEDWPVSGVLPKNITCDNGSEYLSYQYERFACDNGIGLSFTQSAMGSHKGNIEAEFRQFNLKTNGLLPGQKIKGAYGKPDERTARLTMEEFEMVVLHFILYHNKKPMLHYKANKEIYEAGIVQSPNNIWNYYEKKSIGCMKHVPDMDRYRLSLLCSESASITREGIVFKNLIYTCEDVEWLRYQCSNVPLEGRKKLEIKYDKRCMDVIFYKRDDDYWQRAMLNMEKTTNEKYLHKSYASVFEINSEMARMKKEQEAESLLCDVELLDAVQKLVKEAKKEHKGVNTGKNKEESRKQVQAVLHQEKNVVKEIGKESKVPESHVPFQKESTALSFEEQLRREEQAIYFEMLSKIEGLQVEVP